MKPATSRRLGVCSIRLHHPASSSQFGQFVNLRTPGDFAVVTRKAKVQGERDAEALAAMLRRKWRQSREWVR